MYVAGVDIGNQTGKAVILRDDGVLLGKAVTTAAEESAIVARQVLVAALAQARLDEGDLAVVAATGIGRNGIPFAHRKMMEVSCDAKGATHLSPSARTVIDLGAEDARGIRCDEHGKVLDFVMNDKCASGAGVFIEAMAKALELSLEQMAAFSLKSLNEVDVNCTCAVFAESEVVSLVHRRVPREDIARGVLDSIALRSVSMMRRIGIADDLVVIGGCALNAGMVHAIARRTGKNVLIPEDPIIVGALGAALYAIEGGAA